MKMERFVGLTEKEVINVCDGKRLGHVCDLEVEMPSGKICALFVPQEGSKWNFFGSPQVYRVPWGCVRQIGDDIILVEVDSEEILEDACCG